MGFRAIHHVEKDQLPSSLMDRFPLPSELAYQADTGLELATARKYGPSSSLCLPCA